MWGISVILSGEVAYRQQEEHHFVVWAVNLNFSTTKLREVEYRSFDTSLRAQMTDEEYNNVKGRLNDLLSPAIITSEEEDSEQPTDNYSDDTSLFESESWNN